MKIVQSSRVSEFWKTNIVNSTRIFGLIYIFDVLSHCFSIFSPGPHQWTICEYMQTCRQTTSSSDSDASYLVMSCGYYSNDYCLAQLALSVWNFSTLLNLRKHLGWALRNSPVPTKSDNICMQVARWLLMWTNTWCEPRRNGGRKN